MKNMNHVTSTILASVLIVALVMVCGFGFIAPRQAYAQYNYNRGPLLSRTLLKGMRGNDVAALQQFLATNYLVYPQRMVTGYYGSLTKTAIIQFQIGYGLPVTGAVDYATLTKLNSLYSTNHPIDVSGPTQTQVSVSAYNRSATVYVRTDEAAQVSVFYDTHQLSMYDSQQGASRPYVSGVEVQANSYSQNQSISLSNLQPRTTYYFLVESIDDSGNVTVTVPTTFTTTQ